MDLGIVISSNELGNIKKERLSAPREGVSLESVTERKAVHIRKAVSLLADGFDKPKLLESFNAIFAPRWELHIGGKTQEHSLFSRAAWNLVCIWLLARSSGGVKENASFKECEEWFLGGTPLHVLRPSSLVTQENLAQAQSSLMKVSTNQDFWDLFPYILQEVGLGSRSAVLRNPHNRAARVVKKNHGIFYTPTDVADYMVRNTLANYSGDLFRAKCFDPACGTGVFLLALCREIEKLSQNRKFFNRFDYVTTNLFGCDISAHAVDACTFVLLWHCLSEIRNRGLSPWSAWHAIRLNITNVDSVKLNSGNSHLDSDPSLREKLKRMLLSSEDWIAPKKQNMQDSKMPPLNRTLLSGEKIIGIGELFKEAKDGFHILVGNPPYSRLADRNDYELLSQEYHSFTRGIARPQDNIFLLFIEMVWRLTVNGQNSSSLVTPLSIAYNSGPRFADCRQAMSRQGGLWKFAFFDREPHALFGEEVKTRNAILFRIENNDAPRRGENAIIETGPLRKWTSRTRKQLFESIQFTRLEGVNIADGIPKIEGEIQFNAFNTLKNSPYKFESFCKKIGKCSLEKALRQENSNFVYVGGTAYNFLNVFRKFSANMRRKIPLSESPIHCLEFVTDKDAAAAFAILSSRLVFWLWHTQADGFHVPSWFIRNLPFQKENFSKEQMNRMSKLGLSLWSKVQDHRFSSTNGGRFTCTFRPLSRNIERDEIDSILVRTSGLAPDFVFALKDFVRKIVVIDESDNKRKHLKNYFTEGAKLCLEN